MSIAVIKTVVTRLVQMEPQTLISFDIGRSSATVGAPFDPLNDRIGHRPLIGDAPVSASNQCNEWRRVTSVIPAGESKHQPGTEVQAIKLSPYRAGLAEPALQRFRTVAALPTCYFPPRLSL